MLTVLTYKIPFVKKLLILIPVFAFAANIAFAQDEDLPPPTSKPKIDTTQHQGVDTKQFQGFQQKKKIDLSKFIIEPDFNFDVAGNELDLGLSPYVGYKVWKELFLGGGVTYLYSGFHDIGFTDPSGRVYYANAKYKTIGGGVFAQYNIWKGFFARAKFELLYRDMDNLNGNVTIQVNPVTSSYQVVIPKVYATIPDLLLGVGYNLLRSKNFFFPIIVSYNVLYPVTNNTYSVYPHGVVVQLGFINIF